MDYIEAESFVSDRFSNGGDAMIRLQPSSALKLIGVLGLFFLTTAVRARAQETEIRLDQVPKKVIDAAKDKFPGAIHRGASKETEEGQTLYEMAITYKAHRMDVSFKEDGTLVLVETELRETEVPSLVLRAVKDKYPGGKIKLVESVKKGPKVKTEVDYYEFHLTTADKKSAEVEVDAKGTILKTEESKGKEKDEDQSKARAPRTAVR
jgi:uncharacterized membrane protein YkoI